jgi:predicted GIY-YIG superfamily endonuclease
MEVVYVGESTSVSWRVDQHRDPGSPFMAAPAATGLEQPDTFVSGRLRIRALPAEIGRLELEEAAIACLRPTVNRMRRVSRPAIAYDGATTDLWQGVQEDARRLLREGVEAAVVVSPVRWVGATPPRGAGVYIVRDANGGPLYVGESDALAERLRTHTGSRSYFSALRRHVGTEVLGLAFAPDVRRGFSPADESAISTYLSRCSVAILPLAFGRWELERELVHDLRPALNREHAR